MTQGREVELGLGEGPVRGRIAVWKHRIGRIGDTAAGRLQPKERAGSPAWQTCSVVEVITERGGEGRKRTRGGDEWAEGRRDGGEERRGDRREEKT